MSKKTAIILSIICFFLLAVLVVLEKKYPEALKGLDDLNDYLAD